MAEETMELDHLMWGAPSLEAGMREVESLFGIAAAVGGVHPGLGTCNALLSLGDRQYLEIIAPDPAQDLSGSFGGRLASLEKSGLVTWAAAASGLDRVASRATELALNVRGPSPTERTAPDGSTLSWELLFLSGHPYGSLVPFFIDWLETPHPAATNPAGGSFERLEIRSPEADKLGGMLQGLGLNMVVQHSDEPGLTAVIATKRGEVRLDSVAQTRDWTL